VAAAATTTADTGPGAASAAAGASASVPILPVEGASKLIGRAMGQVRPAYHACAGNVCVCVRLHMCMYVYVRGTLACAYT
jgi:hypothetical protein